MSRSRRPSSFDFVRSAPARTTTALSIGPGKCSYRVRETYARGEDDLDLGLKDRAAIVTGGSRGIGKACAKELLAEGAIVVLVSKSPDSNAAATRELGGLHPDRVLGVPTDLDDDAAVAAMTAQVVDRYGRIDILVNSAATVVPQDFFKMGDGQLANLLDQKFNPAARCICHVVPHMRKRKWGRIINISGLAGRQPHFAVVPAALNNSAMLNLTKALAAELAKDNILVNAVVPYIIDSERQEETMREWAQITGQAEAEVRKQRVSRLPVGRMGRPEEVGAVVAFMASERSSYVVGTAWYVDGGGSMTL
jgi:3-oxoacyl-[acyl-carrier protein] reductase